MAREQRASDVAVRPSRLARHSCLARQHALPARATAGCQKPRPKWCERGESSSQNTVELMPAPAKKPSLPDGLVAVVKRDCAACSLIEPVLRQLKAAGRRLTVYTQDDPTFPSGVDVVDDRELEVSWHHAVETVPTLMRVESGAELERTVGWNRKDWEALTGVGNLGTTLPAHRPGCGSLSVHPDNADALGVRFSGSKLKSRRIELASLE